MPALPALPLKIDKKNIEIGGVTLDVSAASDADVFAALVSGNEPFPGRDIEVGRFALSASDDLDVTVGGNTRLNFGISGELAASLGVFTSGADVLRRLDVGDAETLQLELADGPGRRYLLMRSSYGVTGSSDGTHPVGALGTVTFGVEGSRRSLFAVVQAFASDDRARDVLQRSVDSWRLPRSVRAADELAPGTWVIAEADGSIAARLATQLGYDFTFVRELKGALKGDIGLKIDLGLKAMVGFEVSGRYVVVLERPAAVGTELRCRIFKVAKKGWQFGLNLTAGVKGVVDALPQNPDDLIAAVFGAHGPQVVRDLQLLDTWTDPETSVSELIAGLTNQTALGLLHDTTGIDPGQKFDEARGALLSLVKRWNALPSDVTATLWKLLQDETGFSSEAKRELLAELELLADPKPETVRAALQRLIGTTGLDGTPIGKVLVALGGKGVLALLDRVPEVSSVARRVRDVLDGTALETLVKRLTDALRLEPVLSAVTRADFDTLDGLLVDRLSAFLDRRFNFDDLDEVKDAIHTLLAARNEIYTKVRQAVSRRYEFELAYSYQKASTRTALIDAQFDTAQAAAAAALRSLLNDSDYDALFVTRTPGVELRQAVLTHELTRQSSLAVTMPFYASETETLSRSLASVRPALDGDQILFYELDATNVTARKNRFRSQLSASAALAVPLAGVRVYSAPAARVSYRYVHAQVDMRRSELEHLLAPFVTEYFQEHFAAGGQSSFDTWLTDLDRRVEEVVHNGTNEFGDVLLALEVLAPAASLQAWLAPRSKDEARRAAKQVSLALQASLKRLIAFNYFRDIGHVRQNVPAAALLVYASIPPVTNVQRTANQLRFNEGDGVYWDWPDRSLRRALVESAPTRHRLQAQLAASRARLIAAGLTGEAAFFTPGEAEDFENLALAGGGEQRLEGLLFTEAMMVDTAAGALRRLEEFRRKSTLTPSAAIEELAKFGDAVTRAFQERVTDYGHDTLRPLGTMLFLEAARALDPALAARHSALLALTVLRERRTFVPDTFLGGDAPTREEVAVEQRLVTA